MTTATKTRRKFNPATANQSGSLIGLLDAAGAARADRDAAALTALSIDTGTTFYQHGTRLMDDKLAQRDRAAFEKLPLVGDGMEALRDTVLAEDRRDHRTTFGRTYIDSRGMIIARDVDGAEVAVEPEEVGWARLASFAPEEVPTRLRSNINAWVDRRHGDEFILRTRKLGNKQRSLFAAVSTRYVPFDLDEVASVVADAMPADARVRVRYDGARVRIDVVLHNPHHFEGGKAGTVGELHRLTLRFTTADDGTSGFTCRWGAERIRCINLTLLRGSNTTFRARHTRDDLRKVAIEAIAAHGDIAEEFQARWRDAWRDYYVDQATEQRLGAEETFKRLVYAGNVRIPGLNREGALEALMNAYAKEEDDGGSRASILNAVTRAAHEAPTTWKASSWADDEVEEQAGELLYARVALVNLPDDAREALEW